MENNTMTPKTMTLASGWQAGVSRGCATFALPTALVEGLAVRATDAPAIERTRTIAAGTHAGTAVGIDADKGFRGANAARVLGSLTWSPPV